MRRVGRFRPAGAFALLFACAGAAACGGSQSALAPAGPQASHINWVWWVFFGVCAVVYFLTVAALVFALARERHTIPGIPGARGRIGPPLQGVGSRHYLAGRLENTPENLVRWIQTPQDIEPGTVMPDMDVTERDARDIAAYLYTLR